MIMILSVHRHTETPARQEHEMTDPKLTNTQSLALAMVKEIRLTKNQVAIVDEWNGE